MRVGEENLVAGACAPPYGSSRVPVQSMGRAWEREIKGAIYGARAPVRLELVQSMGRVWEREIKGAMNGARALGACAEHGDEIEGAMNGAPVRLCAWSPCRSGIYFCHQAFLGTDSIS